MPLIALLVSIQSLCLYSSVARIPVGLALLAFNTYPLWTALRPPGPSTGTSRSAPS